MTSAPITRMIASPSGSRTWTERPNGSSFIARDGAIPAAPGWQAQPVALEDLVLAYLRRPSEPSAAVTSGVAA